MFEAVMLENTANNAFNVEGQRLVLIPKGLEVASIRFAVCVCLGRFIHRLEFIS
jgi:hypothetical protein